MDFGVRIGSSAMQSAGSRNRDLSLLDDRGRRWAWGGARLAPGATVEEARAELETLSQALEKEYPDTNEERSLVALPFTDVNLLPGVDEGVELASLVLMVVVGLVLLIACANLANMLLARALGRRREIATRLSVGASRRQVVRQLFVESLMLALIGGGLGLLLALGSNRLLNGVELPSVIPMRFDLVLDLRVVLFTLLISTVTALVFGMAPAFEVMRTDLAQTLREEGAARSAGRRRKRIQGALVVAQVALSVLLLIFAGLMVRSVQNAERIDPGFDPDGLVTAFIDPELQGYPEDTTEQLFERLKEEMASMPAAESVSEASMLPLSLWINTWGVAPEEQRELPEDEWPDVDTAIVGPGYFETMDVDLLRGRTFREQDRADSFQAAVVNEALARRFWPDGDAIGRRLYTSDDGDPIEVVGVVATGKYRTLGEDPRPFLYLPSNQTSLGSRFLIARFDAPAEVAVPTFRRAVRGVDSNLAMTSFGSVTEIMSPSFALPRLGFLLFGGFGLMGLLLASIGLYGLLAFTVGQRRHEIGIRMAMGADRGSILGMVVRQGLTLTAIGAALGLVLALLGTRALEAVLYGISATDAVTFGTVVGVMLLVALLACWLPARRAARLDPNGALRYD
jgi:putative ABC transport system permease protein